MEKFVDIVQELNAELYDNFGEVEMNFGYTTNGYCDIITFGDNLIWDSENDERNFDEKTGEYEPFIPFIKLVFNDWVDEINSLKF